MTIVSMNSCMLMTRSGVLSVIYILLTAVFVRLGKREVKHLIQVGNAHMMIYGAESFNTLQLGHVCLYVRGVLDLYGAKEYQQQRAKPNYVNRGD